MHVSRPMEGRPPWRQLLFVAPLALGLLAWGVVAVLRALTASAPSLPPHAGGGVAVVATPSSAPLATARPSPTPAAPTWPVLQHVHFDVPFPTDPAEQAVARDFAIDLEGGAEALADPLHEHLVDYFTGSGLAIERQVVAKLMANRWRLDIATYITRFRVSVTSPTTAQIDSCWSDFGQYYDLTTGAPIDGVGHTLSRHSSTALLVDGRWKMGEDRGQVVVVPPTPGTPPSDPCADL
jgi:hypothetical protein